LKTEKKLLIYDVHLFHQAWCPLSLYNRYWDNGEISGTAQIAAAMGKEVNGNPYWLEKPTIQEVSGGPAESRYAVEYMKNAQEDESSYLIEDPTILYDPKNGTLINVHKLVYKHKAWIPLIYTFNVDNVWFKHSVVLTAAVSALRNNGLESNCGYLIKMKDHTISEKYEVTEPLIRVFEDSFVSSIKETLEGKKPERFNMNSCKRCAFKSCEKRVTKFKTSKKSSGSFETSYE